MPERSIPEYLKNLNTKQYEAVVHEGSPLLILAGAGSGKTSVITSKIAWLIDRAGIDPASILAVTFTNKAAREMEERVTKILVSHSSSGFKSSPMIRTFHSLGAWILRRNAEYAALKSSFTIYDEEDMVTLLQSLKPGTAKKDVKPYVYMISRAKDYCLTPDDDLGQISYDSSFPDIYRQYQDKLNRIGNADFGDLIMKTYTLLAGNKAIRERLRQRFSVIMVDEYQDSNVAQFELLKLLAGEGASLTVVGDDDQSIYRFRGAEVKNILTFADCFPGTKIIRLEQNYRSTSSILDIASSVVSRNSGRLGKKLWTEKKGGEKAAAAVLEDQQAEAQYCADILKDRDYSSTAILYRTNAQSLAFESLFTRRGIPYRLVGALKFYEREEIKDMLAYISLFLNPGDEVSLRRIINKPARGIGKAAMDKIAELFKIHHDNLIVCAEKAEKAVGKKAAEGIRSFSGIMKGLIKDLTGEGSLSDFIRKTAVNTGLAAYYRDKDDSAETQRLSNIQELVNHAADYSCTMEGLTGFIENIELDRGSMAGEDAEGVTLITMHNTKGLEFDRVIITGLEEGLFPGFRSMENIEDLEEERRIFYVSITRAREKLYLTCCRSRRIWGKTNYFAPSRFLDEIPGEMLETVSPDNTAGRLNSSPGAGGVYNTGDFVYSNEYGYGRVTKKWENSGETIILAVFESGKTAQFLAAYCRLKKV